MLSPKTEEELAEIIASATAPLSIRGGHTRGFLTDGDPITTSGMSGISVYEPGALTLVAKAGTPVSEIEAALAAENQMLAFEPMDHRDMLGTTGEPTIGGIVATNTSGPRRVQAGACRDFLLGVRFVDGSGTVIKNGGRVMKNVTGYDLARLMCGAHGTLGVLSEVSLKVLPKPETEATLTIEGLKASDAVPAMSAALSTPFEVTGAFFGPYDVHNSQSAHIRVEGSEASVRYRIGRLKEVLAAFGSDFDVQEGPASARLWRSIRDVDMLADAAMVLRTHIAASRIDDLLKRKVPDVTEHLDWGGGRTWISATEDQLKDIASCIDEPSKDPDDGAELVISLVRGEMEVDKGHCTIVKASEMVRRNARTFQPEVNTLASMARALRGKYDPKGVLNPGLMD